MQVPSGPGRTCASESGPDPTCSRASGPKLAKRRALAEYASFWNWSLGDRGIASLADLLKLQILDTKGHDRFKNLKVFWEQRSLPLVGPRLWSRLCPEVRLALLSHLPLNTLLEESFAQSLEDRFANVRKGLAAYLGVPVIERLQSRWALHHHGPTQGGCREQGAEPSSSRAAAMDDPDLRVSISNISRQMIGALLQFCFERSTFAGVGRHNP